MASTLKVIFTVSGIFLTGAVTGGFAGFRLAEHYAGPKRPQTQSQPRGEIAKVFGHLAEELKFTPEQKERIRPILTRASEELRRMRTEAFTRTTEFVAKTDSEIAEALTPEQREQLQAIRAREERRRQELLERARVKAARPNGEPGEKTERPSKP